MTDTRTCKEQRLTHEIAALDDMSIRDLRTIWRRLYRSHPPKSLRRDLIQMAVAWKLQERTRGGLNAAAKRQLMELAQTLESKTGNS